MAGLKIVDLYAQVGVKIDKAPLVKFMQQLRQTRRLMEGVSRASRNALVGNEKLAAARERTHAAQIRTIATQNRSHHQDLAALERQKALQLKSMAVASKTYWSDRLGSARVHSENLRGMRIGSRISPRQPSPRQNMPTAGGGGIGSAIASGIPSIVGAAGLYQLSGSFMHANKQMDKTRASLLMVSSGSGEAAQQLEYLKGLSRSLGTDFESSTQQFMNFAATAKAAGATSGQIRTMFTGISTGQAALGMSADDAEGATRALTQMLSKGKVMSEELKGQLAERVPGAVNIMAQALKEQTGGSVMKLFDLMEKGLVDSTIAVPKFIEEWKRAAKESGAAEAQSKSLQGSLNKLSSEWTIFLDTLGQTGIKNIVGSVILDIANSLRYLSERIAAGGLENLKQLFVDIADNAVNLANKVWYFREVILLAAGAVGVFVAALMLAKIWAGAGGLLGILFVLIPQLWGTAVSAWAAVAPFLTMALVVLAVVAAFALLVVAYQDWISADSILRSTLTEGWLMFSTWFKDNIITPISSFIDKMQNMTVGGLISGAGDFFGGMLNAYPATAGLTPSQKGAAGSTNNDSRVVNGGVNITVASAAEGKVVASGILGEGTVLNGSYGNAASP